MIYWIYYQMLIHIIIYYVLAKRPKAPRNDRKIPPVNANLLSSHA